MNLPKIHSITKKVFVAILGTFLLLFLLFHAMVNLCILRHDDGLWYGAFCHFMGTNVLVKVFELVLMGAFLLHIALTLWLWFTNKMARPNGYKQPSKTKVKTSSKLQVWTGILIFVLLIVHFCDFYFVKLGLVEGKYMVKTEEILSEEALQMQQTCQQYNVTPDELIANYEQSMATFMDQLDAEHQAEAMANLEKMKAVVPLMDFMNKIGAENMLSDDKQWVKHITPEDKEMLEAAIEGVEVEPDFYNLTREKFKNTFMAIIYLIFFVIVWFHMRHAFAAVFQTFGLYNYKYGKAIEIAASVYAWIVCLAFAAVVILVYTGLR